MPTQPGRAPPQMDFPRLNSDTGAITTHAKLLKRLSDRCVQYGVNGPHNFFADYDRRHPSPNPSPNPNPHQALSAYDASAVRACIVELHSLHRKATSATLRAVFDKYATPDLLAVSGLTPPETLPLVLDTSA